MASELAQLQDDAEHWQPRHKTSLEVATRDFDYEEAVIRLRVGDRTFNIARRGLTQRSPVFREMFSLPQPASPNPPEVVLHDDRKFFAAYLWLIHADHLDVLAFNEAPADDNYLRRWYGIAYTAHKYQANSIATYAIGLALDYLQRVARDESFLVGAAASLLLAVITQWGADTSQGTRARQILRIVLYRRAHFDADWSPEDAHHMGTR
ncbi:hypothetical protein EXIGLDRAFT_749664 [Exidia glandulosa HHB12029]|uniref:BTB domain-containing protein n=1 Tax=Exidia glandulosa HHB12029 TaxID=1314781 RepID=A0A165HT70_EXIGL|nr:hypothetical protein EXIGLDRAFT_749664 [Exidia glandulosa HHB12029]